MTHQQEEQNQKLQKLLLKLGRSYLENNRYHDAFNKLTQLIKLEPENVQALGLAVKAAIALEDVSEQTLDLYSRAVNESLNLETRKHLRTLLDNHDLQSPASSEIKQKLDALTIPVEANSKEPHPNAPDETLLFEEDPQRKFAFKIKSLWLNSRFDDAIKTIRDNNELPDVFLQKQLALTIAYQSLTRKKTITDSENIQNILIQIQQLKPNTLDSLRELIVLTHALPEEISESNGRYHDSDEYEFILGNIAMEDFFYDLQKKKEKQKTKIEELNNIIFNELQKAQEWNPKNEIISHNWHSFLTTSLFTRDNDSPPEKIIKLVASYLFKIPQSVLRFTEDGFVNFAENPLKQVVAVSNLYKSIDHYNEAAKEGNQITLNSSIIVRPNDKNIILDTLSFQETLLKSMHLLQQIEAHTRENHSLYIDCQKTFLSELRQIDEAIQYEPHKQIDLLLGVESECYSIQKLQKEEKTENDSPPEIQDLKVLEKLGSQTPCITYLAKNKQLERTIILKTFFDGKKDTPKKIQRETLLSNIKKMGRLNHVNIATLFDLGESNEQIYYTREYVEGDTILTFNKSEEGWEINFLKMLENIIKGLQTAEKGDVFHLNLKPSNIWINETGVIKITDFSIFQAAGNDKDYSEIESTQYLAPEVIQTGKGDSRSDIYSLGLITYEVLTGNSPYKTDDDSNSSDSPSLEFFENEPSRHNQNLAKTLRQATQKKPEKRFQTFNEFEIAVQELCANLSEENKAV